MLTIVKGDDKPKIAGFIRLAKARYSDSEILEIKPEDLSPAKIRDALQANGFFATKKFCVFNPKKLSEIDLEASFWQSITENRNIDAIIDVSGLKQPAEGIKIFKGLRSVNLQDFVKPRSFDTFKFADDIIIHQNKVSALRVLESIPEDELILVVSSIMYNLRCFFSVKYHNEYSKTLKPFVLKKMSMSRLTEEQAVSIYSKVLILDLKFKSENMPLKDLITDFVISLDF